MCLLPYPLLVKQRSTKRQKIGDPSFEGILEVVASLKRNQRIPGSSTLTDAQELNLQDIIFSSNPNNELFVIEDLYRIVTDPNPDPRFLITGTSGVGYFEPPLPSQNMVPSRRERINIQIQEKNIKYVRTAQNLSNYNDDDVVIRPTVKNFGAVDLFVMPDYVFQITVSKKHPIKQKELVKIIPNMLAYRRDSNAIIRLVFVVPDDIYDDFEYQNYVTPKKNIGDDLEEFKDVERLSPVLNNVEQWVLKIDMSMRQQE
ncbi:2127_t:CDS:2 [Funneliformis geosporum]|uniref:2127_t:CDS:1 n=1 Tax=Funneliformis geosporum TaxID=1117311 RepID=A0A9W4T6I9_9GLOM|nr:2127_t:CDS:2 [Funneliformis geosporum]